MAFIIINLLVLLISIITTIIILYKGKYTKRKQYEFVTTSYKKYRIFGYVFVGVGLFLELIGVILSFIFNKNSNSETLIPTIMGLFFYILSLLIILDQYFDYEAIENDTIIVHRFYCKEKRISISEIDNITFAGTGIIFQKKDGKLAFTMDIATNGIQEFINIVNERRKHNIIGINQLATNINDKLDNTDLDSKYELIGKHYRENSTKKIKYLTIGNPILFCVLFVCSLILFVFEKSIFATIFLVLSIAIFLGIKYYINKQKKELEFDDEELGINHILSDNKVKGYGIRKRKNTLLSGILISSLCLTLGIIALTIVHNTSLIDKSELTSQTYHFEYVRSEKNYIAFGFYEKDTEYRIPSYCTKYFNKSFYTSINDNDEVTILIDKSDDISMNKKNVNKHYYNDLYGITAKEVNYFTYEDYCKGFNHDNNIGKVISYVFISIGSLAIIYTIINVIYINKNIKYEDIEI